MSGGIIGRNAGLPGQRAICVSLCRAGRRPFTPIHASGEAVEVDEVTGGWREGSTHYFEGALVAREALRLETAVDLTGISRVITLPLTLEEAAVGQSWSLDWPLPIGAAQLRVSGWHG